MCILALAPALSYSDHCPTSCWTNNYFVVTVDRKILYISISKMTVGLADSSAYKLYYGQNFVIACDLLPLVIDIPV